MLFSGCANRCVGMLLLPRQRQDVLRPPHRQAPGSAQRIEHLLRKCRQRACVRPTFGKLSASPTVITLLYMESSACPMIEVIRCQALGLAFEFLLPAASEFVIFCTPVVIRRRPLRLLIQPRRSSRCKDGYSEPLPDLQRVMRNLLESARKSPIRVPVLPRAP